MFYGVPVNGPPSFPPALLLENFSSLLPRILTNANDLKYNSVADIVLSTTMIEGHRQKRVWSNLHEP